MIFLSRVQLILKLLIRMCRVFLNVLSLILKKPLGLTCLNVFYALATKHDDLHARNHW